MAKDVGQDAPRYVWEEMIAELRDKIAAAMEAAADGDKFAQNSLPEMNTVRNWILQSYALRFNTEYVLPDPEPGEQA